MLVPLGLSTTTQLLAKPVMVIMLLPSSLFIQLRIDMNENTSFFLARVAGGVCEVTRTRVLTMNYMYIPAYYYLGT